MLNEESGLLGVSKISSDIRDVEEAKKTNERAKFAIDLYVRKIADSVSYTHLTLRRRRECRSRWSPYH